MIDRPRRRGRPPKPRDDDFTRCDKCGGLVVIPIPSGGYEVHPPVKCIDDDCRWLSAYSVYRKHAKPAREWQEGGE